jgi:peptidoglycan/LPS O-acetylase OafA/YrhL
MATDKRIPGLDGLRAISIVLVMIGHLAGTRHADWITRHLRIGDTGELGVRVFFVISGFLITGLLLKEYRASGTISLQQFYIRRTLRIFPAFYAFLLVIACAYLAGAIALRPGDLLYAFTYTINYHYDRSWFVGHIWSLSVEEQFYILWPATLLLLGPRRGLMVAFAVVLCVPAIRLTLVTSFPSLVALNSEAFFTVSDSIALGCVLAGSADWIRSRRSLLACLRTPWFVIVPLCILLLNMKTGGRLRVSVIDPVINVLIAACVLRCSLFKDDLAGYLLNAKPVVFVGVLSYSLYLWQQPFLNRYSDAWFASFPQNLLIAVCCALGSYFAVERPVLRLRRRVAPRNQALPAQPPLPAQPRSAT